MDNPSGENRLPAFTTDLSASSSKVDDVQEVGNVDTGIQGSASSGKRIIANWGISANSCTKTGNKEMVVGTSRRHPVPPDQRAEGDSRTTRTLVI